jgi:hypothetical protein
LVTMLERVELRDGAEVHNGHDQEVVRNQRVQFVKRDHVDVR